MPFVATSVKQLRVRDEVAVRSYDEDGDPLRSLFFRGQITEIRSADEILVMEHGDPAPTNYVFDGPLGRTYKRTWTVLNRDLEPEIRVGDRVAVVDRREGVVRESKTYGVTLDSGIFVRFNPPHQAERIFEILERAPEPLTPEQKLEKIKALLEEDSEGTDAGISCAGYKVTDDGCYVSTLAAKITAVLKG